MSLFLLVLSLFSVVVLPIAATTVGAINIEADGNSIATASPLVSPSVARFLQLVPPMCAQALFFSGLMVAFEIRRSEKTSNKSPLPFVSMFICSAVWSLYGVMVGDYTILSANTSGLLVGLYCTKVFHDNNTGPSLSKWCVMDAHKAPFFVSI